MNISFNELSQIKHKLPTGSVKKIAQMLEIEEQTARNYFGANKFKNGKITGKHVQPGPNGGIVSLKDTAILDTAMKILKETAVVS